MSVGRGKEEGIGVTDFGINHGGIGELNWTGKELVIQPEVSEETATYVCSVLPG